MPIALRLLFLALLLLLALLFLWQNLTPLVAVVFLGAQLPELLLSLWILTSTFSPALQKGSGAQETRSWGKGIYLSSADRSDRRGRDSSIAEDDRYAVFEAVGARYGAGRRRK